jgi:hypothetical protein
MTMMSPTNYASPQAQKIVPGQVFQANVEAPAALPGAILSQYLGEFQQTAKTRWQSEDGARRWQGLVAARLQKAQRATQTGLGPSGERFCLYARL